MVNFSWARVRLFNKLAVQTIYEACLDDPTARVTKVQSKPKNKWRPVALDTIVGLYLIEMILYGLLRKK